MKGSANRRAQVKSGEEKKYRNGKMIENEILRWGIQAKREMKEEYVDRYVEQGKIVKKKSRKGRENESG